MSMMISEVYEAFRAAGVDDDKARAAAESVANLDSRLARIDAELAIIKWVVSGVGLGVLLLVVRSFWPG